ncbi:MAG: cell division protein FtsQ/DivIB [Candidatus Nanopelagicales bacterium]
MRRRVLFGAIAALLAAAVGLFWFSPVFDVRSVRIFGTHYVTQLQVLSAANITIGEPIARVDVNAAALRVSLIPQVASVDVRRGFPHAIVIEIHERVAIAASANPNGSWWLVDKTGAMFQQVTTRPASLTAVEGYTQQFRGVGARIAAGFPQWLRDRVAVVQVRAPEDVQLQLRSGKLVSWGGEERAARKAQVLLALLHVRARFFDVSAPDAPATRK